MPAEVPDMDVAILPHTQESDMKQLSCATADSHR